MPGCDQEEGHHHFSRRPVRHQALFLEGRADWQVSGLYGRNLRSVGKRIGIPKWDYVVTEWTTMIPGCKSAQPSPRFRMRRDLKPPLASPAQVRLCPGVIGLLTLQHLPIPPCARRPPPASKRQNRAAQLTTGRNWPDQPLPHTRHPAVPHASGIFAITGKFINQCALLEQGARDEGDHDDQRWNKRPP